MTSDGSGGTRHPSEEGKQPAADVTALQACLELLVYVRKLQDRIANPGVLHYERL